MSEPTSQPPQGKRPLGYRSLDCIDVVLEEGPVMPPRPLTGKLLEAALKERARIEEWLRISGGGPGALGRCVDVVIEVPEHFTPRPATGKMRELLLKERERLAAWREWERLRNENPDNPPPIPQV